MFVDVRVHIPLSPCARMIQKEFKRADLFRSQAHAQTTHNTITSYISSEIVLVYVLGGKSQKQACCVMLDLHTAKPTRKMARRRFRHIHRLHTEHMYQTSAELHDRREKILGAYAQTTHIYPQRSYLSMFYVSCSSGALHVFKFTIFLFKNTNTGDLHGRFSVTLNDAARLVQLGGAVPAKKQQPCWK